MSLIFISYSLILCGYFLDCVCSSFWFAVSVFCFILCCETSALDYEDTTDFEEVLSDKMKHVLIVIAINFLSKSKKSIRHALAFCLLLCPNFSMLFLSPRLESATSPFLFFHLFHVCLQIFMFLLGGDLGIRMASGRDVDLLFSFWQSSSQLNLVFSAVVCLVTSIWSSMLKKNVIFGGMVSTCTQN